MDFIVRKTDLLKELQYVQGIVERKNTVPILSHLLLETAGNSVQITATDLDVSMQCASPANIKVSGALSVSARKLFDIARLLPEADIHFKATEREWLQITCEKSKFKVAGLSKENFPDIPVVDGKTLTLPTAVLRYMIVRSVFAISQEESRYTLNGALLFIKPGSITMVATDGHRLALVNHFLDLTGVEGEMRVLVPKKALIELNKLVSEDIETLEFASTENHLFFRVGKRLLVSRLLAGQFPNYEMVIPRENNKRITVNTLALTDALKRAAIMADEQSRAARFSFRDNQLDILATSADVGESRETVAVDYTGEPLEVGFNAQYLLDFLSSLESENVLFELRDAETQGLLKPQPEGEFSYNYVVMPMKL